MRTIQYLVVHCTATPQTTTVSAIQNYWRRNLGWKNPGYHFIILADGSYRQLQPIEKPANGVKGFNKGSIHIAYIGGVDAANRPADNRTPAQKRTLFKLLKELKAQFPRAVVLGHRDFRGVTKACPSFDAMDEYGHLNSPVLY